MMAIRRVRAASKVAPPTASRSVRCVASSLALTSHCFGIGILRSSRICVVAMRAPASTIGTLQEQRGLVSKSRRHKGTRRNLPSSRVSRRANKVRVLDGWVASFRSESEDVAAFPFRGQSPVLSSRQEYLTRSCD